MKKDLPHPSVLRQLLRYEQKTGRLFWTPRTTDFFQNKNGRAEQTCKAWNTKYSGKEAFTYICNGYKTGAILNKACTAHRAIWAIVNGKWPDQEIDHINGDRSDNRIKNLRCVSSGENQRNRAVFKNNTSGVCGVHWEKSRNKWKVSIHIGGKPKNLGRFDLFDEAILARKRAEQRNDYHENHGRNA